MVSHKKFINVGLFLLFVYAVIQIVIYRNLVQSHILVVDNNAVIKFRRSEQDSDSNDDNVPKDTNTDKNRNSRAGGAEDSPENASVLADNNHDTNEGIHAEELLKAVVKKLDNYEVTADPSPEHLKMSSKSLERSKVCEVGGLMDDISYAVIAKLRRGIIENERLALEPPIVDQIKPKILCMVFTYEGAHKTNLQSIVDTWASQCDGFLAASNVTDVTLGAVDIKFYGPEAYGNMWRKIEAMWEYAYKYYSNEYDYFHICGDDAYVIPENLRVYLMGKQVDNLLNGHMDEFSKINDKAGRWETQRPRPLLLGFPLTYTVKRNVQSYAAGGSGYTLNRAAVKAFHERAMIFSINITDSREDIIVAKQLASNGITCADTRDGSGAFRYAPNNPINDYRDPDGNGRPGYRWHGTKHLRQQVKPRLGFDAFSNETVAIHLNYKIGTVRIGKFMKYSEEMMYRFDDFLSGRCDEELLSHSPNVTKIKYFESTQKNLKRIRYWQKAEAALGMPRGYLSDERNK